MVANLSREEFMADRRTQLAVWKLLEIIGEAARQLSEQFTDSHQDIPWGEMVGLRNVLVHDYRNVNLLRMWRIARQDIPTLVERLEPLVPPPPCDPEEA